MGFFTKHSKLIVVLAVVAGATSSIFTNYTTAPSIAIGFWRLAIATPVFAIIALLKNRDDFRSIAARDYVWAGLAGLFLACHFFCWFTSCRMTDVSIAAVLASFHPIVVMIITIIVYKKKVPLKAILGILVALVGGALVAGVDVSSLTGGEIEGKVLALLTGVFMGLYFAVGNSVRSRVPGNIYVFLVFSGTLISFFVAALVSKTPLTGYPASDYLYIGLMAILCQICSHAMFNLCIGHVSSLYVSTIETGECVVATVFAMIFLGQFPGLVCWLGVAVVVGGLLYYNYQVRNLE